MDKAIGARWPNAREDGRSRPRDSANPSDYRRILMDVLESCETRPWPWWSKVRMYLESSGTTVTELAKRAGLPRRSLHRWLYEVADTEMYDRGPPGEIGVVVRLARALGLSPYAFLHPAVPWPVPQGVIRFGAALRDLFDATAQMDPQRRASLLDATFAGLAETAEIVHRTVVESAECRQGLHERVRRTLEGKVRKA